MIQLSSFLVTFFYFLLSPLFSFLLPSCHSMRLAVDTQEVHSCICVYIYTYSVQNGGVVKRTVGRVKMRPSNPSIIQAWWIKQATDRKWINHLSLSLSISPFLSPSFSQTTYNSSKREKWRERTVSSYLWRSWLQFTFFFSFTPVHNSSGGVKVKVK